MGFAENMRILSNIHCGLASTVGFMQARIGGMDRSQATYDLFTNLGNGIARNEVAYEWQKRGNPAGNIINQYYGYANPQRNAAATIGLMGVCMPWILCNTNSWYRPSIYHNYSYSYRESFSYFC